MDPQTPPAIWEYVSAGEYKLPAASIGCTFKGGLAGLWQRLKPAKPQESKDPLWSEKDLRRLPEPLLTGAAPRPTWGEAAARLEAAVAARSKRQGKALSPTVVIGLPHGGNAEILEAAAESRGCGA